MVLDLESVWPVVRRVSEPVGAWRARLSDPERVLLRRPFVAHLDVLLALDLADRRVLLTGRHLLDAGIAEPEAWAAAERNLIGLDPGVGALDAAEPIELEGELASSMLLHASWLAGLGPDAVVCAPTTRALWVGTPEQAPALWSRAWDAFREGARPLSPVLYTAVDRTLAPWSPVDPVAAVRAASSARLLAAAVYAEQREDLVADPDVAVDIPEVRLVLDAASGGSHTVCTWGGGPALLPRTDRVVVGERELTWDAFRETWPCTPTAHVPERCRVG